MENEAVMFCPLIKGECKKEGCAFWCGYGGECAISLLTGILADSTINLRYFS